MAKKKEEAKIILERVYNIPLRRQWLKVPRYKRARKAIRALRAFLQKHMKSKDVKIGKYLNLFIAKHGMKNPPHLVKVATTKDDKGIVKAELVGAPKEEEKKEEKKPKETKKEKAKPEKKEEPKEGEEQIEAEFQKQKDKTKKIEEKKKIVTTEEQSVKVIEE